MEDEWTLRWSLIRAANSSRCDVNVDDQLPLFSPSPEAYQRAARICACVAGSRHALTIVRRATHVSWG